MTAPAELSTGKTLTGAALFLVATFGPSVAAFLLIDPWWAALIIAFAVTVFANAVVALIVARWTGTSIEGDPLGSPSDPLPVHDVAYDARGVGCTDRLPHDPHEYHWRSEMPYRVFDTDGSHIDRTAPITGSVWCRGVTPTGTPR